MSQTNQTEAIDHSLLDLDLRSTEAILQTLLKSQQQAVESLQQRHQQMAQAVDKAAERLGAASGSSTGRLVLAGAGASGRLAVQDGAEMWPTYGWPASRLLLCMAGGEKALLHSVEGVEDDGDDARAQVLQHNIGQHDVVLALAASGRSPWTCSWLTAARERGALTIGFSNNEATPLLDAAEFGVFLDSGAEILAGSTRMAAGTAQKVALNLFSTALMVRLNRTYGNLMVDMAAVNSKLDGRRLRMLKTVLPDIDQADAERALADADGWVKLAVLMASGLDKAGAMALLEQSHDSLRDALAIVNADNPR